MSHIYDAIVIKQVSNTNFELALVEMSNGSYRIVYEVAEQRHASETVRDYKLASFMFDSKLIELEGQ